MNPDYNKHLNVVVILFTFITFILICCTNNDNKKEEEINPVIVTDSVSTYNPIYNDSTIIVIENDYAGVDQ